MRSVQVLVVCSLALACVPNQPERRPGPTSVLASVDSVASIGIEHGIGGWGNGANFRFDATRTGLATYDGGIRAVFSGDYRAAIDTSLVSMLIEQAIPLSRLPITSMCADNPTADIVLVYTNGSQTMIDADCHPPASVARLAAELDSIFASLDWHPAKRAT